MAKRDIYKEITDRIIADLENGVRPWVKPWSGNNLDGAMRPLRANGKPYSGINVLVLWSAAEDKGYTTPTWMTFKQAKDLGGSVRKGEKSERVVFASTFRKVEKDEAGEENEVNIPFLKTYSVFNVEQIDGLPDRFYEEPERKPPMAERDPEVEQFFAGTGATINHGGNRAFYSPKHDQIQMPIFEAFNSAYSYYTTLGHECVHWTKHESRLDRSFGAKRFGDNGYAQEELVAEIGAAFLAADLGLALDVREDHSSYIQSWLEVLKNDKRAIFTAASHASKAVEYLHGLQESKELDEAA